MATNLPSVPWGNSANLHPGQTVLAFGNPYGYRFTVTRGIVSALNRPNPDASDRRKPGEFIQTDAAINPGNSGGALVDARGELIGINTFLISSSGSFSGMGFAIPTQIVQPTVETLIRDGKMTHAFIGIQISDLTPDNAKFFEMSKAEGAVVTDVQPDAPGAKAGLRTGDVITELDGKPVTDAGQLQMIVGQKRPGDTVHLQVVRESKPTTIPVTLEALGGGKGAETAGGEHKGPLGCEARRVDAGRPQRTAGGGFSSWRHCGGSPARQSGRQCGLAAWGCHHGSEPASGKIRGRSGAGVIERAARSGCAGAGVVERGQHLPRVASVAGVAINR